MKRYVPVVLLVALAMFLAGCAAATTPAPVDPGEVEGPAAFVPVQPMEITPREGFVVGEMIASPVGDAPDPAMMAENQVYNYAYASPGQAAHWDPIRNPGGATRDYLRNLFLPLLRTDQEWNIHPGLALAYEYTPDFTTFVFHLDPEAVWSDGTPFVAQDVLDAWNYYAGPNTLAGAPFRTGTVGRIKGYDAVFAGEATEMEGLIAVDDNTLEIQLTEPDPTYIYVLLKWNGGIPPADQIIADPELWATKPGAKFTGPLMIKDFDAAVGNVTLVPNPNYWRSAPILQEINFIIIEDVNTQLIMVENKELEMGSIPVDSWPRLEEAGIIKPVEAAVYPYVYYFWFMTDRPPLDDINVRKALIHAIDHETAFVAAMNPVHYYWPANAWIPLGAPCTRNDVGLPGHEFDVDLAVLEAAQSTYGPIEDWPGIRIQAGSRSAWEATRMAEVLLEMWKNNLGLTNIEYKLHTDMFPEDEQDMVQINRLSAGFLLPDPAGAMLGSFGTDGHFCANFNYCNEELQAKLQEAFKMDRTDPAYCETVQEAEDMLWNDFTYIGIFGNSLDIPARVASWTYNMNRTIDIDQYMLEQVWIAKH